MNRTVRLVQVVVLILAACAFSVSVAVAQQQQITEITGTIDNTLWSKDYALPLQEGQSVLITVEATSGDLDTYVELYSPSNLLVSANDDRNTVGGIYDSALGYTALTTGTYTVRVTRYEQQNGTSTGEYLLTITVGDASILSALQTLFTRVELSGPVQTVDTPNFRIHYTIQGRDAVTQEYLDALVAAAEEVWDIEINQMGWPPPPTDNGAGGDNRYDFYIMDLIGSGEGALGITSPESFVGDHPATPEIETNASTSYILVENDMQDVSRQSHATDISLMRATVGHEFHHAIQFGYDAAEPNGWFFEATATWMETAAMGKDEDATGYVDVSYSYPEICFATSSDPEGGAIRYGDWTFIEMLSLDYGMTAVQDLWRQIANFDNLEALDAFATGRGEAMPDIVARWRLRNLARDYVLAPRFNATVWLENTITEPGRWTFTGQGIQEMAANYFAFDADPGTYYAGLVNDDGQLELYGAGISGATMDVFRLGRGGSFDTSNYDFFYLMVFKPQWDNDPESCVYDRYDIDIAISKDPVAEPMRSVSALNFAPLR